MHFKRDDAMMRDWTKLVLGVQSGNRDTIDAMYRAVIPGMRMLLSRRVPRCYVDDYAHDSFLALVRYIQTGAIQNAKCLPGIARTIVLRVYFEHQARRAASVAIEPVSMSSQVADKKPNPEDRMLQREKWDIAMEVLQSMRPREREILRRFYLENQSPEQICAEMGLTETQFRLIKSRAKSRFGELGRKKLRRQIRPVDQASILCTVSACN